MALFAAFLFGIVAGSRTSTAPAIYFLFRSVIAGVILAVLAIGEYVGDALPKCPPRTQVYGVVARLLSGGIVGWFVAGFPGALVGLVGALIGTYGGIALRMRAIERIGPIPAAFVEDAAAIVLGLCSVYLSGGFHRADSS